MLSLRPFHLRRLRLSERELPGAGSVPSSSITEIRGLDSRGRTSCAVGLSAPLRSGSSDGASRQSAARIFITDEMRQSFEAHFPECRHDRNWVIPNGTDLIPTPEPPVRQGRDIVHAGSLYGDRSLVSLLSALNVLIGRNPILAGTRVLVYGDVSATERQAVTAAGLGHLLEVRGRISRRLREARALLVISGDQMAYSIPYKLYDYLAACKPILAVANKHSAVARFMREHPVGRCVDPADVTELGRALEQLLLGSERPVVDDQTISAYLWSALAEQYVQVLRILAADRPAAAPYR